MTMYQVKHNKHLVEVIATKGYFTNYYIQYKGSQIIPCSTLDCDKYMTVPVL